jgi:hypothetical protein
LFVAVCRQQSPFLTPRHRRRIAATAALSIRGILAALMQSTQLSLQLSIATAQLQVTRYKLWPSNQIQYISLLTMCRIRIKMHKLF